MGETITLPLRSGVATVYKIGDDWTESYWQRRAMENNPADYGGLFLTRDAALAAAKALAAEIAPHMVGGEDTRQVSQVSTDWSDLYAWLRTAQRGGAFNLVSTPIETTITAQDNAVRIEWRHQDKIIVTRQVPSFVMVAGVRYEGPATSEVVVESPTFRRTTTRHTWHGVVVEDIASSHTIYVTEVELRFAVTP